MHASYVSKKKVSISNIFLLQTMPHAVVLKVGIYWTVVRAVHMWHDAAAYARRLHERGAHQHIVDTGPVVCCPRARVLSPARKCVPVRHALALLNL